MSENAHLFGPGLGTWYMCVYTRMCLMGAGGAQAGERPGRRTAAGMLGMPSPLPAARLLLPFVWASVLMSCTSPPAVLSFEDSHVQAGLCSVLC